jgi:hypothetical protein
MQLAAMLVDSRSKASVTPNSLRYNVLHWTLEASCIRFEGPRAWSPVTNDYTERTLAHMHAACLKRCQWVLLVSLYT